MKTLPDLDARLRAAAAAIRTADALVIGAGAGMGVDSGLPDFRGPEGFWKAYPPFRGQEFADISTPHWFKTDPAMAWGFFGHRLNLYRAAIPHGGFDILRHWSARMRLGYFVYTSNVDGQFQKARFPQERVVERHGSIHYLQCVSSCSQRIWPATDICVDVDESVIRAQSQLPRCMNCDALARPNILMFGDWGWISDRCREQIEKYHTWINEIRGAKVVAIEMGAGLAIPTVRNECETQGAVLIRINPRESDTPDGGIPLPMGALEALGKIDALLG